MPYTQLGIYLNKLCALMVIGGYSQLHQSLCSNQACQSKACESHQVRGPVHLLHHSLHWLERTLNEYSLGLKAVHETTPPDAYSKAKSALQSCLEVLKAKLSQTNENLVRVQAETRVSVRAIVTKPIRLVRIEHAQSVMVSSTVLDDTAARLYSVRAVVA